MRDKLEGDKPVEQARNASAKSTAVKRAPVKPRRKVEPPTVTDDLTGKFLRVGNKLYRTSGDTKPFARIEPDRLKTDNIDALPDIVRLAKANGWTAIRIDGGDIFKKAAFLAAAAQGLDVENYTPTKLVAAEADRLRARLVERNERRVPAARPQPIESERLKALSERFLAQTSAENARDPDLRKAQTLVAQVISIARARYPDDPSKVSTEFEAKRREVAGRIARGDTIIAVQVRKMSSQRVREQTHAQALKRDDRSR